MSKCLGVTTLWQHEETSCGLIGTLLDSDLCNSVRTQWQVYSSLAMHTNRHAVAHAHNLARHVTKVKLNPPRVKEWRGPGAANVSEIRASCLRLWIRRSHTADQVWAYRLPQQKRKSWLGASSKEERGSLLPDSGSVFIVDRCVCCLGGCTWAFPATRPTTWPVGQGPSQPGLHTGLSSIIYRNPV